MMQTSQVSEKLETTEHEPLADQDLILEMLLPLVKQPDQLRIEEIAVMHKDRPATCLRIYADPQDRGRVIGKEGVVLDTLRTYFKLIGMSKRRIILVELYEPDRPSHMRRARAA